MGSAADGEQVSRTTVEVFDLLRGDATATRTAPFGTVGTVYSGAGIEVVWVEKRDEPIDPDWFEADTVDILLVLQGTLRVEFADGEQAELTLEPGQVVVLPPRTRCRAYRWPRDAPTATIFLAAYPAPA